MSERLETASSPDGRQSKLWYTGPNYTVDPIVITTDELPKILLIKRKDTGTWALPGGFVDQGESSVEAARRELHEETGLAITNNPLEIYAGIVSDPRTTEHAWIETTALLWRVDTITSVTGDDDATDAAWFPIDQLPSELYGSHSLLIKKALETLPALLIDEK